jgi:predicted PurR-regulated permease PerM
VRSLEKSRLGFVYREVAGSIRDFATVLGKSLEAQFTIAVVNAILTALGVAMLGLGSTMAFLTVIVFLCSFIPVLGVFISSVPICLIALQASGLTTMFLAIVMITVIHLIEGYVLNPRIYGSYMRINPVIVLFILTIGAKLFHIWGLVLGVPICTYIFGLVAQRPEPEQQAVQENATDQAGD